MFEGTVAFNGFSWNVQADKPLTAAPFYFARLDSVDGLWGADLDYESYPIAGAIGERSGDVIRRGRTITLTGVIEAASLGALRACSRAMQAAVNDKLKHNLTFTLTGEPQIYFKCRVSGDLVIVEQQKDLRPWRPFVVAFRADDPRSRKVSDNTVYPVGME